MIQNQTKAFSEDLKYEQYIEIPSEYSELESISIEKTFVIEGTDHWINYALIFMRPSKGVGFTLTARDDLVIKEVIIFGDDTLFSKEQKEKSLSINSDSWISNNNGFMIIVAENGESK